MGICAISRNIYQDLETKKEQHIMLELLPAPLLVGVGFWARLFLFWFWFCFCKSAVLLKSDNVNVIGVNNK